MSRRGILTVSLLFTVSVGSTDAQDASAPAWRWTSEATVFVGVNHQDRKFRDFTAWESQNWFMGTGVRDLGEGRLFIAGMLSLEPLTLKRLGSPQVFQTGESYRNSPLIDYQHPHDLIMQAAFTYERPLGAVTSRIGAALVGTPALGPPPFMHRASASYNPQVPLSHHQLDATHITPGVMTAGLTAGRFAVDASVFHGREPDERRYDVDLGALDSWSARAAWTRGAVSAQFSGGRLHSPEALEPYFDQRRLTASIGFDRDRTSALIAWGENREFHGALDAYLAEGVHRLFGTSVIYSRAELVTKDILDAGSLHPRNAVHSHRLSRIAAFTAGYARDVVRLDRRMISVGADVTGYHVATNLKESYGSPVSYHVFVRFAMPRAAHDHHQH